MGDVAIGEDGLEPASTDSGRKIAEFSPIRGRVLLRRLECTELGSQRNYSNAEMLEHIGEIIAPIFKKVNAFRSFPFSDVPSASNDTLL